MQLRSRGAYSRPSFAIGSPLITRGAGKAGRRLHPWPACRKECRRQSPQVRAGHPGLPCAMVLRLLRGLPGAPGFLVTVARATRQRRHARGIGIGMPGPHGLAVRLETVRRHDRSRRSPKRPPHPAPDVRDGRETPLVWGGTRIDKHDFRKKERRIFSRLGLDRQIRLMGLRNSDFWRTLIVPIWRGPLRSLRQQLDRIPTLTSVHA